MPQRQQLRLAYSNTTALPERLSRRPLKMLRCKSLKPSTGTNLIAKITALQQSDALGAALVEDLVDRLARTRANSHTGSHRENRDT